MPPTQCSKNIKLSQRIILALDVETGEEARSWVEKLEDQIKFYKIGLQLFLAEGFSIVDWIVQRGHNVMLDLKFFDVPQTVGLAVKQLNHRGIAYATIHGNDAIMKAAATAAQDVKILAVTVLTSFDEEDLRDLGLQCSPLDLVRSRARRALELGCDGVVSSGLETLHIRKDLGGELLVVVPGVRPGVDRKDDQKRVVTAREAFLNGADHVVVGRPIRQAEHPMKVVEDMLTDTEKALVERESHAL